LFSPYDDRFKVEVEKKNTFDRGYEHKIVDTVRYTQVEVPFTELYPNFDDYVKEEEGMERVEDEDGEMRYGYYTNPNSKWDWYQIGGRWAGMLRLREGAKLRREPEPSWGWSEEDKKELMDGKKADMARKREIDWEGMMQEGRQNFLNHWDKAAMACGIDERGHIKQPAQSWEALVARVQAKEITIDDAREIYRAQPEVVAFNETKLGGWNGSVSDYDCTRDEYGERGASDAISTFAVLLDGEWHERGSMGWWGMSSETDEQARAWQESFYDAYIKNLPDNAMITVVDCHI
jgi:hypothetical protein